jgi:hypothetical protein
MGSASGLAAGSLGGSMPSTGSLPIRQPHDHRESPSLVGNRGRGPGAGRGAGCRTRCQARETLAVGTRGILALGASG